MCVVLRTFSSGIGKTRRKLASESHRTLAEGITKLGDLGIQPVTVYFTSNELLLVKTNVSADRNLPLSLRGNTVEKTTSDQLLKSICP